MRWITRENANVDRVACPWLIRRFIDPDAEFLYVPRDEVVRITLEGAPSPMAPKVLSAETGTAPPTTGLPH